MLTYSTTKDFIDRYGIRTAIMLSNLDDANATEVNEVRMDQNRQSAFSTMNAIMSSCPNIAAQMPFPLEPQIPFLRDIELKIVNCELDQTLPRQGAKDQYDEAMKLLLLIGQCKLGVGLDGKVPGEIIGSGDRVSSRVYRNQDPVFSDRMLEGYL